VTAILLAPGLSQAAVASDVSSTVTVRIYDRSHKDYHVWDDREDQAYRHYLSDQHQKYRHYSKLSHKQPDTYWNWRHAPAGER
jgi:hypothetical protein